MGETRRVILWRRKSPAYSRKRRCLRLPSRHRDQQARDPDRGTKLQSMTRGGFPLNGRRIRPWAWTPVLLDRIKRERLNIREIKGEPGQESIRRRADGLPCGELLETDKHLSQMHYSKSPRSFFCVILSSPKMQQLRISTKNPRQTNYVEDSSSAR